MEGREEENVHLVYELLLSSLGAGRRTRGSLSWPGLLPTRVQVHQEHGRQTTICLQGTDEGSLPSAKGGSEPLLRTSRALGEEVEERPFQTEERGCQRDKAHTQVWRSARCGPMGEQLQHLQEGPWEGSWVRRHGKSGASFTVKKKKSLLKQNLLPELLCKQIDGELLWSHMGGARRAGSQLQTLRLQGTWLENNC